MNQINTETVFDKRTVGSTFVEGIDSSMNVDVPAMRVIASNDPYAMLQGFVVLQGAFEIWVRYRICGYWNQTFTSRVLLMLELFFTHSCPSFRIRRAIVSRRYMITVPLGGC